MDENKRKKLQEIGYEVLPACGLCQHGDFKPNNDFGDCKLYTYEHKKHSDKAKPLSILRYGTCNAFGVAEDKLEFLHAYQDFLK